MNFSFENYITVIGIIISIIVSYFTARYTVRAIQIQDIDKGKVILYELLKRYFFIFQNSLDYKNKNVKKGNVAKQQYLTIVEKIEEDFYSL